MAIKHIQQVVATVPYQGTKVGDLAIYIAALEPQIKIKKDPFSRAPAGQRNQRFPVALVSKLAHALIRNGWKGDRTKIKSQKSGELLDAIVYRPVNTDEFKYSVPSIVLFRPRAGVDECWVRITHLTAMAQKERVEQRKREKLMKLMTPKPVERTRPAGWGHKGWW